MPESLKYISAPLFRNKLLMNKEFLNCYNNLENREVIPPAKLKEYQFNQLKQILIYSFQNVPYYTELFNEINFKPANLNSFDDIKIIPFMTKEIIRENFDKLISVKRVNGGCYRTTTSGSTGEPLELLLDYSSFFKENAFIYHFRKKLGYHFKDRLVTFRGVAFGGKLWSYNPMHNEIIFSPFRLSHKSLELYVKKINEIRPSYLNGYFSSIYYFAKLLSESNFKLNFRLKGIFFISEKIDAIERHFVESFFEVKSSTFYGHTERCIIAQEIHENEYAFDPYYGFTEVVSTNDNNFNILGTGFLNKTMPLVRYLTDDFCLPLSDNRYSIVGKRDLNDFLFGINGEKISSAALHFISDFLRNIIGYQFIQNSKGKAILLLVPTKNFKESALSIIKCEIERELKGIIEFEIKVEEKLLLTSSGKFKMFIRMID
jgi:phenylacetate-CoA ligase